MIDLNTKRRVLQEVDVVQVPVLPMLAEETWYEVTERVYSLPDSAAQRYASEDRTQAEAPRVAAGGSEQQITVKKLQIKKHAKGVT
ncbi:unnamed protein product [Lota lota]